MHRVLILGAGKIGALISGLLAESGAYRVLLADVNGNGAEAVARAHDLPNLRGHALDAADGKALDAFLKANPVDALISCLPYYCNVGVAEAARRAGTHYFDLTEDVAGDPVRARHRRGIEAGVRAPVRARAGFHQHRGQ